MRTRGSVLTVLVVVGVVCGSGGCEASGDATPEVAADAADSRYFCGEDGVVMPCGKRCVGDSDCDDGDPCTYDSCVSQDWGGSCAHHDVCDVRDEGLAVDVLDVSGDDGPSEVDGSDGLLPDDMDDEKGVDCPCGTPCETDADCDDGDPCTVEHCEFTRFDVGYCDTMEGRGTPVDCGPGRTCDPATGACREDCVLGTSVPCSFQNAFGACLGVRACEPAGLADCDAPEPSKEQCDTLDNNCNGQTDEGFPDADQNGVPDCLDDNDCDKDGDGIGCSPYEELDNCPHDYNPGQANWDKDHLGGVLGDNLVYPGAAETCDGQDTNCDGLVDEGFANADGDSLADCVDPDKDNDSILNEGDNCPLVYNPAQTDGDGDGVGDACE